LRELGVFEVEALGDEDERVGSVGCVEGGGVELEGVG